MKRPTNAKPFAEYAQTSEELFEVLDRALTQGIGIVHCAAAALHENEPGPAPTERIAASLSVALAMLDDAHAEVGEAWSSLLAKRANAKAKRNKTAADGAA